MYNTLKRTVLISLAALLLLPVFVAAFPSTVQAAPYSEDTVQEKAEAWLFARAISKCFRDEVLVNDVSHHHIDEGNAEGGWWFYNDRINTISKDLGIIVASIMEGGDADDGKIECSYGNGSDNLVDEGLSRLGLEPIEALCAMGDVWRRENPGSVAGESCTSGSGYFETDHKKSDRIQEAWNSAVRSSYLEGKGLQESLTDAMRYWISLETFRIGCKAEFKAIYDNQNVDGDKKYKTPLYNKETGEIEQWYTETQKGDDVIVVGGNGLFDSDSKQHCSTLEENLDKYIDAYVAAVKTEADTDPGGTQTGAPQPTCEADGFGWVICPLINMMAQITETVADALDDYLRINPLTTDTDSVLYKGWSNIVGIANILLVIAFMLIVFSQATSIGIGNYGIKKLLPRIIAAAILINISYFICAVLVDLSNIAGASISDLIYSNLGGITNDEQEGGFIGGVKNVAGGVAAGVIAASGLVVVAFFFLIPAVVAILSIFVVLAARTAIITLLIIIAPLAFAAWILPNTDKWFRRWWDTFLQMLLIYPAIMAIFAASTAAASIVVDSSGVSANEAPGPDNLFPLLIGLLIQALPLFALPALIKLSSGVLARIDGMTSTRLRKGADGKLGQSVRSKAKSYGKFGAFAAGSKSAGYLNRKTGGRVFDPDKPGRATRAYRGARTWDKAVGTSLEARKQGVQAEFQERAAQLGSEKAALKNVGGSRYQEIISAQVDEAFRKRVSSIRAQYELSGMGSHDYDDPTQVTVARRLEEAIKTGNREETAAAIQHLAKAGGSGGREALTETLSRATAAGGVSSDMQNAINTAIQRDSYGDLINKRGDVVKGGFDSQGRYDVSTKGVSTLGTGQLAAQDYNTLLANFDTISAKEAKTIFENPTLEGTISDDNAREILKARSEGRDLSTLPPKFTDDLDKIRARTAAPTPPPTPPPAGGGGGTP